MSAEQAQREPTMEEILASIRRIISEEDRPPEAGEDVLDLQPPAPPPVETSAAPEAAPAQSAVFDDFDAIDVAPEPEPHLESQVLAEDLMIVERQEEATEAEFEEEPAVAPPQAAAPKPAAAQPQPAWRPMPAEPLTSEPVASQAAGSLSKLMGTMTVSTGTTLDDVVRELLKPMLKEWLDANLSQIVEAEVAKEIDRIRRMAR